MFKYEIFPRLGEISFGGLLGGEILQENNIQYGWHKLQGKCPSSVVFDVYQGLMLSLYIRNSKATINFYMSSLLK